MNDQNIPVMERDVRELSLGDMFIQVFRHWKALVICAVIGALLFTGFSCVTGASGPRAWAAQAEAAAPSEEPTLDEASQTRVDGMRDLRTHFRDTAVSQGEYLQNSIYMQLDPYAVNRTTACLFVMPEGTVSEAEIDALVSTYQDAALSQELLQPIADDLETDFIYLREVVSCAADYDLNKITINVSYPDLDESMNICQRIVNTLEGREDDYSTQLGDHRLVMTTITKRVVVDTAVFDNQAAVWDDVHNNNVAINKVSADINDFRPSSSSSSAAVPGYRSLPKDVAIGAAAGLIVCFVVLILAYLLSDKLRSDDEVRRMAPVRVWTNNIAPQGHAGSALAFDKLQGMTAWKEGAYQRFADIFAPELEGKESLLLVTTLKEDEVADIAGEMEKAMRAKQDATDSAGFTVNVCANVSNSYTAVEAIRGAEAVLAVERAHTSSLKKVRAELELLSHVREDAMGVMVRGI